MKIKANNFSGIKNGKNYRITFKFEYVEILKQTHVVLFYKEEIGSTNVYIAEKHADSWADTYKEALKEALIKAENEWGLQLLKSDLKIVA